MNHLNIFQSIKLTESAPGSHVIINKISGGDKLRDKLLSMGLLPGLKGFSAAILGGVGSIPGAIIGGIVIKIGDLVIDGSLAKDLKNIREKLLSSKVRSEAAYED